MSRLAEQFIIEHIQQSGKHSHEMITGGIINKILEIYPQRFTRTVSHGKKTDTVLDEVIEEVYDKNK